MHPWGELGLLVRHGRPGDGRSKFLLEACALGITETVAVTRVPAEAGGGASSSRRTNPSLPWSWTGLAWLVSLGTGKLRRPLSPSLSVRPSVAFLLSLSCRVVQTTIQSLSCVFFTFDCFAAPSLVGTRRPCPGLVWSGGGARKHTRQGPGE